MHIPNDDEKVTYFGQTDSRNRRTPFGIKNKDRSRHTYVIGKTGMGKSTLLENMAIQDIQNGHGIAFIDPHGKTADLLLDYVPESRIKDVLYFAPFDLDYPISFNVMEDIGPDKRHLVANGLMATFEKIWVDAWSARMAYILNNTLLALLEFPEATLLGINRMLSDKDYRKRVVDNISDPAVRSFWVDEFAKYTDRFAAEATPAIQNKVGQFTSNPLIRNIIGQPKSTFNIRKMMDEGKILIINLSKGLVGEGNANLLGSMLITKIYLSAMSRADVPEPVLRKTLPNFFLFVDEFQSFANKSFADILSEARKYKLNLTIAHQYIEQMEEEVRAAVFGNVGTMITFRVGAFDAEVLEKEFAPQFTAEDLVNLGFTQIYLKLMIDGVSSPPFSAVTLPPIEQGPVSFKKEIIEMSRKQFARPRSVVEAEVRAWHESTKPTPKPVNGPIARGATVAPRAEVPRPGSTPERPHRSEAPHAVPTVAPTHKPFKEQLSLSSLRQPERGGQLPTFKKPDPKEKDPRNLSDLRKALASVLHTTEKPAAGHAPEKQQKSPITKSSSVSEGAAQSGAELRTSPPASAPHDQQISKHISEQSEPRSVPEEPASGLRNEVPEDVLRKILKVEE